MLATIWCILKTNSAQLQTLFAFIQAIAICLVPIGLYLTYQQMRVSVIQTRATIQQDNAKSSRELVMKVWDDPKLRPILDPAMKNTDPKKIEAFLLVLIQHYSTTFRQWSQGSISEDYWQEVKNDACQFLKNPTAKQLWPRVKALYKMDFQHFVEECSQWTAR